MIQIDILEKIIEASGLLNEVDNYMSTLGNALSEIDSKQQDLLHLIENNKLKTNECYKIIKELHNVRTERRRIKNDIELANSFKLHKNQLLSIDNRKFLINLLSKLQTQLITSKYKNRVYTDEELKELIDK